MRARDPEREYVLLLEPYSYGLLGKVAYLGRLIRGMYHLRTAGLFVVDNAYLPIHVAPHRAGTTVVQVWHAVGALKRFGADTLAPLAEPERTFLHRHYDYVVATAESARAPYAAALRTPVERVLALGSPRTDFFFDAGGHGRGAGAAPRRASRARRAAGSSCTPRPSAVADAAKRAAAGLDAVRAARSPARRPRAGPQDPPEPATRRRRPRGGYDVVADPASEMNDWLALADILITDYSSSIFEFALLRRPLILLVPDLEAYERDPGLYLDYRTEMIGTQVADTDGVIEAIADGRFDLSGYDAFIARHVAADGRASARFVERFLEGGPAGVEVIPFAAMSATSEAPAAFHNAAGSPGPLALIREGISDIRSRRRLVRYLVQADMRKRGADTLLGNFWWVLDPLLQMVVYVDLHHDRRPRARHPGLSALHLRRDPALEVVQRLGHRRDRVRRQPGPADQADPVPEDRAAGRRRRPPASWGSPSGSSRWACCCSSTATDCRPYRPARPGHRGRPVRVHARDGAPGRRRATSSSATSATSRATCCACGGSSRPGCTASRSSTR